MEGEGHDLGRGRNISSSRSSLTSELEASLSYTETLSQKCNKIKQKLTNRKQNQTAESRSLSTSKWLWSFSRVPEPVSLPQMLFKCGDSGEFQLLCGRAPILSYNDVCRLGPTHSDPHRSHSTSLLGRANQWPSICWRTSTLKILHPICSLSACWSAGPGQTVTPRILQAKLLKLCVWNLATVTGLWMHKDQNQTLNQMCNGPEMFLAVLAHAASCDVCGLDSTQCTLHCTHWHASWLQQMLPDNSLARLDTDTSYYELHCFHCTENVFLLSQKHSGLIPNSQDFEYVPTSHHTSAFKIYGFGLYQVV